MAAAFLFQPAADGQDLRLSVIGKAVKHEQTSAATPVLDSPDPGPWRAIVATLGFDEGAFSAVSTSVPVGAPVVLVHDDGDWEIEEEPRFPTREALDAAWPDSASPYVFAFTPAGGGPVISGPVTVNGAIYPNSPRVSNFDAALVITVPPGAYTVHGLGIGGRRGWRSSRFTR